MSSATAKVSSKMKTQSSDLRTLKPILPKLNPMVTRVIEINSPPMQMCKCFVCDERVISSGVPLLQSTTQATNTDLPTKIGQLMGEKFMVVVSADDVLCRKCHALVNHVDKLESDLLLVKRSLRNHLKKKYGLNDDIKETDPPKRDSEPELEYSVVQDVESEEDHEPRSKKAKPTRPIRFRAIKPKPTVSSIAAAASLQTPIQLLKCPACNFITTEPNVLTCHRLVCTSTAYKCTMCDKQFESQKMIRNHKIEAHLTKWICHFCNISFNDETKFTVHMKNHLGDRPNSKAATNKQKVMVATTTAAVGTTDTTAPSDLKKDKPLLSFKCPHCPESFEAFSQLQIHLVNHTSSVTFKCVRCDIGFESKLSLIEHVRTHGDSVAEDYELVESLGTVKDASETLYSCPMCSLSFLQEEIYLQHLTMHQDLASAVEGATISVDDSTEAAVAALSLLNDLEESAKNGSGVDAGDLECPICGERKVDVETLELHRLTECIGVKKPVANQVKDVSESEFQENAGEEASHLETLNPLLYVNSLNVRLVDGNVVLENAPTGDKSNETEPNANSNTVEDILENMFQVKDEDRDRGRGGGEGDDEGDDDDDDDDKDKGKRDCDGDGGGVGVEEQNEVGEDGGGGEKESSGKTFVCADCSFTTQNFTTLKQHFAKVHEAYKCCICKKNFVLEDLRRHMASEHGSSLSPPDSPKGGRPLPTVFAKSYSCVHCGEKFSNKRALHLHEVKHPENLNIQCPDCGEKFARDKFLNEHRESFHKVSHCRFCNKAFSNTKQLKSHESRHLKSDKTEFKCPDCDRIFQTPTGLRHHKAIHTGDYKYKCEFCEKGFVSRVRCEEHRASHTKEARYSCEICGKKFSFQATYWIHRKWHDNPTPYKCEYCGRLFKHSSLLSVHKRKHTGERPYECPHCDQSFAVGNTLKRHLMLHTGVFPFTCTICDQGFSGKHKLALHMSKVHQDNTLLDKQMNKKPGEYKMVVKQDEEEEEDEEEKLEENSGNQTWILTENDTSGSQLLTIQTEAGENIPCALLTDDMIGNLVNTNNGIVEIIPYDTIRAGGGHEACEAEGDDDEGGGGGGGGGEDGDAEEEVAGRGNEIGFILMNQTDRSSLGIASDEEFREETVRNGDGTSAEMKPPSEGGETPKSDSSKKIKSEL